MTIQDAYKKTIESLQKDFILNPALDARLLISHILKIDQKVFLLKKDEKDICKDDWSNIKRITKERLKGKSVASLINKKYFYDLEFFVDSSVLIPRPETEILIDVIIKKFDKTSNFSLLDIGTGSGNISIVVAKQFPFCRIDAIEKNKRAVRVAQKNIEKHGIPEERINLINIDFFHYSTDKKYDLVVSNPPYIRTNVVRELIKKKLLSDPVRSLDGGEDGLDFYHKLNILALNNLKKQGWMILEHGFDQRKKILDIFCNKNYIIETYNDFADINRIVAIQNKG